MTDDPIPSTLEKFQLMLKSRKFWVLIVSVLTAVGLHASGQIDGWQMAMMIIAALAVYSTGIALVDAGAASKPTTPPASGSKQEDGDAKDHCQ